VRRLRPAAGVALAIVLVAGLVRGAAAHSGLRFSSPLDGSTLGAAPAHVHLSFIEKPEPSLATIRVIDTRGEAYQLGRPEAVADDPLSLMIRVRPLERGVYTVQWRVVSAVDGHASAGAFVFGVLMEPTGPAAPVSDTAVSLLEAAARSVFLTGLVLALGAAAAVAFRFGSARVLSIAGAGWLVSACGLVMLVVAQTRIAQAGVADLVGTAVGTALIARAAGIAVMLLGLAVAATAGRTRRFARLAGMIVFGLGSIGCVVAHAASGHAAAGRWPVWSTVLVQSLHIVAAGAWLGGLVVLVAELRARTVSERAIRWFSNLAAVMLVVVTVTGVTRGYHELADWEGVFTTSYGWFVVAKIALLVAIALLGAMNRWRHVPIAAAAPQPLERTARAELSLAVIATIAAGVLGALPPPAGAKSIAGLEAAGADFATSVRATLSAVSDQPGPNRFSVRTDDYDSGAPVQPDRVTLRFTPLDDPGIAVTTLALARDGETLFTGAGANLAFPGRWRIEMLIERGPTSVTVPVDVEAKGLPQFTSVLRPPDAPPSYTIAANAMSFIIITIDPEKRGPNELHFSFADVLFEPLAIGSVVVTIQRDSFSVLPLVLTRQNRDRFTATTTLERGRSRLVVTARTATGDRLRATLWVTIADRD
jgi:copper transport protein